MNDRILIVDDEKNIRKSLKGIFEDNNYITDTVESGEEAIRFFEKEPYKIVFLDVRLPGIDGIETLKKLKKISSDSLILMMSGHASVDIAIEATKLGAYNFFEKPLIPEKILLELKHITDLRTAKNEIAILKNASRKDEMIGNSAIMTKLRQLIDKVAPSDGRVFITGENGTGKELIAKALHSQSLRKDAPFVKINCAAIPKDLIESELFGHEKGSFTGAFTQKIGRFEEANGGTLFLDEIGDMSLDTQTKLLRVLEENELVRVGGNKTIILNVRVVAATNQDIDKLIEEDKFREDLFFRINVIPIKSPALRDRREDIPMLVKYFAQKFGESNGKPPLKFSDEALSRLKNHNWRGNIRELRNIVERIAILCVDQNVSSEDVDIYLMGENPTKANSLDIDPNGRSLREMMDTYEEAIIKNEYDNVNGNVSKLASLLKVDRANLHRKLKSIGIK